MAKDYINISTDFFSNLKVRKLERHCGIKGIFCLQRLWMWAAQYRPDGNLSGLQQEDIEIAAQWDNGGGHFFDSLINLRFIDIDNDNGVLRLHDWQKHQRHLLSNTDDSGKRILDVSQSEWNALRRMVFERDNFTCQYCGAINVPLECDHILPFSRGGKSTLSNLATACRSCNRRKSNRTPKQWGRGNG